ncbi:hypothetical protein AB3G45_19730 [Shinella sp. S4-D37]|uniref:hypothetical protein n=1 Tax=Shinella sp. S4-D37 TaxID=3161999 RepID=UPI0034673CAE
MSQIEQLETFGFKRLGAFKITDALCHLEEIDKYENRDSVYAFVLRGRVMYVGSADKPKKRFRSYRRAFHDEKKNRLVHREFRNALNADLIDVFLLRIDSTVATVDGLPVGMLLGVEAGLILMFDPPWNQRGTKKPLLFSPLSSTEAETRALLALVQSSSPIAD